MNAEAAIADVERRIAARRDSLRSASATAASEGDAAAAGRLSSQATEAEDALRCARLLRRPSASPCSPAGYDLLTAEIFMMLDGAIRRGNLERSLHARRHSSGSEQDTLREILLRTRALRPVSGSRACA